MARMASVADATSAKTTHACPRSLYDFAATMSMILPNWLKMACSDFFSSVDGDTRRSGAWRVSHEVIRGGGGSDARAGIGGEGGARGLD